MYMYLSFFCYNFANRVIHWYLLMARHLQVTGHELRLWLFSIYHIDGLAQERHNSIANALQLRLSCSNPSILSLFESTGASTLKGNNTVMQYLKNSLNLVFSLLTYGSGHEGVAVLLPRFAIKIIAKPGNTTATPLWPDPYHHVLGIAQYQFDAARIRVMLAGLWCILATLHGCLQIHMWSDFHLIPCLIHSSSFINHNYCRVQE